MLSAFRAAFPADRDDVRLLVKSSNGFRHPEKFRKLLSAGEGDDRIIIRDDVIDRAHLNALQRCCDAYVSLHRAEGFGLGLAECMALGKPVIATGWSGNLEFMDSESALLVEFRRIPVREGDYPHPDGAEWAEADVGAAATAMRKLADDPVAASRLGARARTAVLARLSPENAARIILNRVREIKAGMNKVGENHG